MAEMMAEPNEGMEHPGGAAEKGGADQDEQISALVQGVGQGLETLAGALGQDPRLPPELQQAAGQLVDQFSQLMAAIEQATSGGAPQKAPAGTGTAAPEAAGQRVARPM